MLALQRYVLVNYGYEHIYGMDGGGLPRLRREVAAFSSVGLLEFCAKISLTLFAKGETEQSTQIELVKNIFAADPLLRKKIARVIKDGKSPYWVVFTEQQLLIMVKIALQYASPNGTPITPSDVGKAGHWFLLASDLFLDTPMNSGLVVPKYYQLDQMRSFFARQQFFRAHDELYCRFSRFEYLFNGIRRIHPEFDIDLLFSEATSGVSLSDYITFCFFLMVRWVNQKVKPPDISTEWIICKNTYFSHTVLTEQEIDAILAILLLDTKNFSTNYEKSVTDTLAGKDIFAYNFLLLRQRPLVPVNDTCFTCPSPYLFLEKATEGTYWIVENYLKNNGKIKLWKTLPTIWGDSFEAYMNERFKSAFGSRYHANVTAEKRQRADGLLDGSEAICFFEAKYAHWSYKAKLTGGHDDMLPTVEQIFSNRKGLGQITRNIKEMESGKWQLPFDRRDRKLLPILVVGEPMPMDAYNRKFYDEVAARTGALYENDEILPFIVINAEELEILEAIAINDGKKKAESLLIQYSESFRKRDPNGFVQNALDFKHYLIDNNIPIRKNKPMWHMFESMYKRAIKKGFHPAPDVST